MEQSELRGEIRGLRTLVETHEELKAEHLAEIERLRSERAESQRQAEGYAEAVVDYEQQVHELQTELRAATQENERLRSWSAVWKSAAKVERSRSQYWYDEWKYTSQQWAKEPSVLVDWAKDYMTRAEEAEEEASAFEAALTAAEERAETAERKLAKAEIEIERLRTENTMLREAHTEQGWVCPICGRALAMWVSSCDHDGSAPATRTAASDEVQWEKAT